MYSNKKVELSALEPIIAEKLGSGGSVIIPITGTSMLPLLRQGKDSVELRCAEGKLRKYDVPLYKRKNGEFVLHRVVGFEGDKYVMCGDNQVALEHGIGDEDIIGVVSAIYREDVRIETDDARYVKYYKKRVASRNLRNLKIKARALASRARGLFFAKK